MKIRRPPILVKLALDLAMAVFFIVALGFQSIGGLAHEWIGLIFCGFGLIHVVANWNWYKCILRGKYTFRRVINTIINLILPAGVIVLCVSGIINSRHLFGFLSLKGSLEMRQVHSFVAYWGIVFLGVHAGLQWGKALTALKNKAGANIKWLFNATALRGLAAGLVVYGIWASFDREMGSKLFLGFAFDFWDSSRPLIFFYTHNTAILSMYIAITHYTIKMIALMAASLKINGGAPEAMESDE